MTLTGWFQILVFLLAVLGVTAPLGRFMTRVFSRERTWFDPVLRPLERLIYRATGVDEAQRPLVWTAVEPAQEDVLRTTRLAEILTWLAEALARLARRDPSLRGAAQQPPGRRVEPNEYMGGEPWAPYGHGMPSARAAGTSGA